MDQSKSVEVTKSEATPRPYSPQELRDRSKFADPASTSTYALAKTTLWAKYNAKYAPAFQEFRNETSDAAMLLAKNGARSYKTATRRLIAARNKYIKTALDAFTDYVENLTRAYRDDKLDSFHVDLSKLRAAAAKIKPKLKTNKRGGKVRHSKKH